MSSVISHHSLSSRVGNNEGERGGLGNNNINYKRRARINVVVERRGQRLGGKGGRGTTTTTTTMAGGEVASLQSLSTPIPAVDMPSRQVCCRRSSAADCIRIDMQNSTDLLRHPTSSRYRYTPVSLGMPYTKPNPGYLIVVFPPRHLPPTHHRHRPIAMNCVIVTLVLSTARFASRRVLRPPPQPSSTPSSSFPSCLYHQSAPLACGRHGSSTCDHHADVHAPSGIDER
jgi:hypothetical protein